MHLEVLRWTDALVARVAVVLGGGWPGHRHGHAVGAVVTGSGNERLTVGSQTFLSCDGAAAGRGCDHVATFADADGDVADREGYLTTRSCAAEGLL